MARVLLTILFINACFSLFAQELAIKLAKGQKFKLVSHTISNDTGMFNGIQSENMQEFFSEKTFSIKEVDRKETEIELSVNRMKGKSSLMGMDTEYDSDKNDNDPAVAPILAMINKPEKILIDETGKVISQKSPGKNAEGLASLSWFMSKPETELFIPFLIGKHLRVGDIYPYKESLSKEKPSTQFLAAKENSVISENGNYKVDSIQNDVARLSYDGKQEIITNLIINGNSITSKQELSFQSVIRIDIKTGIVLERIIEMDMKISAGAGNEPSITHGKSRSVSKLTRVE